MGPPQRLAKACGWESGMGESSSCCAAWAAAMVPQALLLHPAGIAQPGRELKLQEWGGVIMLLLKCWEGRAAGVELVWRHGLKEQTVATQTSSPYGSVVWLVKKPNGEWWLMMDWQALNEVTTALPDGVLGVLHMQ